MNIKEDMSIEESLVADCLENSSETDTGQIKGSFRFPPDFPAFKGHFPGQPVLPAVVQLAAVRHLAARHLDEVLVPVSVDRVKFKSMVGPAEPVTIIIQLDQSGNGVTISFTIETDNGKAATGAIACRVTDT